MTGKASRGRPLKYGEPTKRTHVHVPESVRAELAALGKANGDLSIGELLVLGASILLQDPARGGLRAPVVEPGEDGAQED